ncbi:MAG: Uncharacterised protein [Cryomorphaceae bacterium]|nr:MAG: Uncharacterised protein [Cryomorphaceae bacterium]
MPAFGVDLCNLTFDPERFKAQLARDQVLNALIELGEGVNTFFDGLHGWGRSGRFWVLSAKELRYESWNCSKHKLLNNAVSSVLSATFNPLT